MASVADMALNHHSLTHSLTHVLSVTLFSLKINSVANSIPRGVTCSMYVDDLLVCYSGKNMATIERQLQLCLNKVHGWSVANGFKFSKSKTVCMHFCQLRTLHPDPSLTMDGDPIKVVKEMRFLGLVFDTKLSFLPHIRALKARCMKALDVLKVLSATEWGADSTVLLQLYRALVRSKLDYGSIVYGSARKSYVKFLDPVHHQGLRLSLGVFRTSPILSCRHGVKPPLTHSLQSLYERFGTGTVRAALARNPKLQQVVTQEAGDLTTTGQVKSLMDTCRNLFPNLFPRASKKL